MAIQPLHYCSQKNGWMETGTDIFSDWVNNVFVLDVVNYLEPKHLSEEAALLMDTAPCHYTNIISANRKITCCALAARTTSLIQPMDQGVIQNLKRRCSRLVVKKVLKNFDGNKKDCLKKYTLKDALLNISIIWNDMTQNTVARSWNKLLPSQENNNFTLDCE